MTHSRPRCTACPRGGAVHRQLYRPQAAGAVDIASYLLELAIRLEQGCGSDAGRKEVCVHVEPAMVPASFASVVGILVTELVMNACKHAYAPDQPGDIDICLFFSTPFQFRMEVRDYGGGTGAQYTASETGLGRHLIEAMSRRLDATHAYSRDPEGMRFSIRGAVEAPMA